MAEKTAEQLKKELAAAQQALRKQKKAKRGDGWKPSFPGAHRGY